MGLQKSYLDEAEDKRYLAERIALEAKAISRCEWHEDIFLSVDDSDANQVAYQIAAKGFKNGKYEGYGFENQTELTDLIKETINSVLLDNCPRCENF